MFNTNVILSNEEAENRAGFKTVLEVDNGGQIAKRLKRYQEEFSQMSENKQEG